MTHEPTKKEPDGQTSVREVRRDEKWTLPHEKRSRSAGSSEGYQTRKLLLCVTNRKVLIYWIDQVLPHARAVSFNATDYHRFFPASENLPVGTHVEKAANASSWSFRLQGPGLLQARRDNEITVKMERNKLNKTGHT